MTLVSGSLRDAGEPPAGSEHRQTDGQTPVHADAVTLPSNGHRPRFPPARPHPLPPRRCPVWVAGGRRVPLAGAHLDVDHPAVPAGVRAAPRQHQAQNPTAASVQLQPPQRGRGRGSPRDALPRQHRCSADPTATGDGGVCGETPQPLLGPRRPSPPVMPVCPPLPQGAGGSPGED